MNPTWHVQAYERLVGRSQVTFFSAVTISGPIGLREHVAQRLGGATVRFAARREPGEIVIEGGLGHAVRHRRPARRLLRSSRSPRCALRPRGIGIPPLERPGETQALMTGVKQIGQVAEPRKPVAPVTKRWGLTRWLHSAGVGTVYRHFPQRSDLIASMFLREIDARADAASTLASGYAPGEALPRWMRPYVDFIAAKRGLAAALHSGDSAFEALPGYFYTDWCPRCGACSMPRRPRATCVPASNPMTCCEPSRAFACRPTVATPHGREAWWRCS